MHRLPNRSRTAPVGGVTTCDGGEPGGQQRSRPHVLVYEGNHGFEHVSHREANRVLGRLANESGAYSLEITDQATFLRDDKLAGVDMVMFNNNVGDMPVDQAQREALERYMLAGGGAGLRVAAELCVIAQLPLVGKTVRNRAWARTIRSPLIASAESRSAWNRRPAKSECTNPAASSPA